MRASKSARFVDNKASAVDRELIALTGGVRFVMPLIIGNEMQRLFMHGDAKRLDVDQRDPVPMFGQA